MQLHDLGSRLWREVQNLVPLFRYLVLQTETHAFCLALACAALIGFFPSCLVMLSILKNTLHWNLAYDVMIEMVRGYFLPGDREFITRNLNARFMNLGDGVQIGSVLWVLLGAAGVFIPLEAGLNRLWHVHEDRPYWKNQIVGFTLTLICAVLGLFSVLASTALHWFIVRLPIRAVHFALDFTVFHVTTTVFFIGAIFALYKFLPNTKIQASHVLPAAILAGVMVEVVRLVYFELAPDLQRTQGPFAISVTFLLLAYVETFVVLGCAFLASQRDRYPWMGFIKADNPVPQEPTPPSPGSD